MKNSSFDAGRGAAGIRVQAFVYHESGAPADALAALDEPAADAPLAGMLTEADVRQREDEARREARLAAWNEARSQTELELRAELNERLQQERAVVRAALEDFERQRQGYFHQLEREVVQLTLAIARKILHRESSIDPLLLAATVRLALDQLASGAEVELVVPPSKRREWQELFDRAPDTRSPRLAVDAALEPDGCRIATATGSSDLSLDLQMREVEQGFIDLLQRRAVAAGRPPA